MSTKKRAVTEELLARIKAVVDRDGARRVAVRWGINRDTLASALAGYQVQSGTIALLTLGLQQEGVKAEEGEGKP